MNNNPAENSNQDGSEKSWPIPLKLNEEIFQEVLREERERGIRFVQEVKREYEEQQKQQKNSAAQPDAGS